MPPNPSSGKPLPTSFLTRYAAVKNYLGHHTRFQEIVEQTRGLADSEQQRIAAQIGARFEEMEVRQRVSYFESQAAQVADVKAILSAKDRQIEKLQKTLRYVKQQKGRKGKRKR
jgi:hypothetical protein